MEAAYCQDCQLEIDSLLPQPVVERPAPPRRITGVLVVLGCSLLALGYWTFGLPHREPPVPGPGSAVRAERNLARLTPCAASVEIFGRMTAALERQDKAELSKFVVEGNVILLEPETKVAVIGSRDRAQKVRVESGDHRLSECYLPEDADLK